VKRRQRFFRFLSPFHGSFFIDQQPQAFAAIAAEK
jgi:hypothetical protein